MATLTHQTPQTHFLSNLPLKPKPRAISARVKMSLHESAPSLAVVGVTGAVGQEFLSVLSDRDFPYSSVKMLASKRSAGKRVAFDGREYTVEELTAESFDGVDIALFSAGGSISKAFGPLAAERGTIVVDNSSAFRMVDGVPLVIPEVNPEAMRGIKVGSGKGALIANPNCSTIICLMAVTPLHRHAKVKRMVVSTYQAASGAGAAAMEELVQQTREVLAGRPPTCNIFGQQYAFNLFSHNAPITENGYNEEEVKLVKETRKIWNDTEVKVTATCIRVPVMRAHAESVNLQFENPLDENTARELLKKAPGVYIIDDRASNTFPTPLDVSNKDDVAVGRIRRDVSQDGNYNRNKTLIQRRLSELEELPSTRGEDLQGKCLLELYGLKLRELQSKVRTEVSSEFWLRMNCADVSSQLFDWGMMRLPRLWYGIGDPFATEADDQFRKKRDAERVSRLEEEEKNLIETAKRKFFAEVLNAVREFQLQIQATQKRRRQRNDGVQAWHGRQRQRATRAEKLRLMALKSDDQEAYMKLVKESKNERLTTLLEETNKLLANLGAAVQRQKDAKLPDGIDPLKDSESDLSELDAPKGEPLQDLLPDQDIDVTESDNNDDSNDLLEGQRQYNSAIHSIQEKVTEQPSLLKGGELRSYQIEGLQWMVSLFNNNLNGILADEMGLGKTIQTISLIAYLLENKGVPGPYLIVAPKAVLPNWVNEFALWVPSIAAYLYDGRLEERKAIREKIAGEGKFNVLITHYDLIMRDKAFLKKIDWHYMIVDEGHRLKNHESALAKTLLTGYRIKRRLLLTGTPIQNSLQELWSLLNFLLPHIFNSVQNFEEWFNAPFADRANVSLTDEEELLVIHRLHHVIRPFILRRKKDEVEKFLPGKTQVILKCDMSAWQKVYYKQVTDMGRVGLQTGSGKSKSLQNLTMQLRKCCNHPYLFVGGEYNMWKKPEIVRASGKFELLDRLLPKLRKAGHRILLFSQMTRLIDILEIYLTLNDFKYLRLDGTTKTDQRGLLLKQFNEPDSPYFMFLLSTRAGGLGLNLQTADTVIIFDSDWNPQMDQQAEDRAHRIGQKKEVRVFVLVSVGSVEEVILERAKQKMGIDAKVIQAGLFNTTSTAQDRREMLEELMRKGTSSLGNDVPSEREINRLAARSEDEFWMFERMDEERRMKESYRTRLMQEQEVPEWAYTTQSQDDKSNNAKYHFGSVTGKRKRKEIVYSDSLSEVQWMKAVESGEDVSAYSLKQRRAEKASKAKTSTSKRVVEPIQVVSDETSEEEEEEGRGGQEMSGKQRVEKSEEEEEEDGEEENDEKPIFKWSSHKKKRSRYSFTCSSSDSRAQSSNGSRRN